MDLSLGRSVAMVHCAREVARGRADLSNPEADRRLLAIPEIGRVLRPGGGPAIVARLGRRATVPEVEEYFAPYAPFRGLAGSFALAGWHKAMGAGPSARLAA